MLHNQSVDVHWTQPGSKVCKFNIFKILDVKEFVYVNWKQVFADKFGAILLSPNCLLQI